jgi:hypothetical protein
MPKEVQESRRSYVDRRADELALSGAFANWHGVKTALCDAGYLEVHDVLFSRRKRALINQLCAQGIGAQNSAVLRDS